MRYARSFCFVVLLLLVGAPAAASPNTAAHSLDTGVERYYQVRSQLVNARRQRRRPATVERVADHRRDSRSVERDLTKQFAQQIGDLAHEIAAKKQVDPERVHTYLRHQFDQVLRAVSERPNGTPAADVLKEATSVGNRYADAWREGRPIQLHRKLPMSYRVDREALQSPEQERAQFRDHAEAGLSATSMTISSMYLYDDTGSRLFAEIMEAGTKKGGWYYPTPADIEIITEQGPAIASAVRGNGRLALSDLGCGNAQKTKILLKHLIDAGIDVTYEPSDISEGAILAAGQTIRDHVPTAPFSGLVSNWHGAMTSLKNSREPGRPVFLFFSGGNIGNLWPGTNGELGERDRFMRDTVRANLRPGDPVLICLHKADHAGLPAETITRAYDDPEGLTGRFNLNLLSRMNRELSADFDPRRWKFVAKYEPTRGGVISHLEAVETDRVTVGAFNDGSGRTFDFKPGARITTEISAKFTPDQRTSLFESAGIPIERVFTDKNARLENVLGRVQAEDTP